MLILSRKLDETVYIGTDVVVKIVRIKGNVVGLGIEAPSNVKVMRSELLSRERPTQDAVARQTKSKLDRQSGPSGTLTIAG